MSNLSSRLKQARALRGVSQADLARGCGLSQPSIANIETGINLRSRALPEIAAFLRISYDWLKYGKGDMNLSSSSAVDTGVRMIPLRLLQDLVVDVPMLPAEMYLPAPVSCGPRTFAVTVEGDAMSPRYPAGAIVYVDPDDKTALNGRRVLARVDGIVVMREYRTEAGDTYLMPINTLYRPITSPGAEIIGAVIGAYLPE